jgi:hypothetical protein
MRCQERELVHDRDRDYTLNGSETRTLSTVCAFRVVSERDLRDPRDDAFDVRPLGGTRRARREAFVKYVNDQLGAKHAIQIVPECRHNDRCVYTTDAVLPVIFTK